MHTELLRTAMEKVIAELEAVFENKGLTAPALGPETVLDGTLGLESIDFAELAVRLEGVFGHDPFSQPTIPEVRTISDLAALF
jgi:acyl carrier protein